MKFFRNISIISACLISINTYSTHNILANEVQNIEIINQYENQYDAYFNKRLDNERAQSVLDITNALYEEYLKTNNYSGAEDALNRQMKYADYLNLDKSSIYQKISELHHTSDLYTLSTNPVNQVNYGEMFENNNFYFGINQSSISETTYSPSELIVIDVDFPSEYIKAIIESKYTGIENSTLYINLNIPSLDSVLANINSYMHYEYFMYNIEYLSTLNNDIMINLKFDDVASLDCELYKSVLIQISNIIKNNSTNIAFVYNYIDDFNYFPGHDYFSWLATSLVIDNTDESLENPIKSLSKQFEIGINHYNKPVIISDVQIKYSHIDENDNAQDFISRKIEDVYNYASILNPQIKGVIYNNKNGEFDNNLDKIKNHHTLNPYQNGTYMSCENYNYDSQIVDLHLYSTASNDSPIYVTYDLNGLRAFETNESTFNYQLNKDALQIGENSLQIGIASNNGYRQILNYNVVKTENNFVTLERLADTISNITSNDTKEDFVKPSSYRLNVKNIM